MKSFYITGANRGLGLALTKKALAHNNTVYCACRNPDGARDLWELENDYPDKCFIVELDVADKGDVSSSALPKAGVNIDFLINNAGVSPKMGVGLKEVDFDLLEKTMRVNAFGAMRVTRALLPYLERSEVGVVAHMSSRLGSIGENTDGGLYAYRMSKAALNMFHATFNREFSSLISVALHPGWVRTAMGGENATEEIGESIAGIYSVLLSLGPSDAGAFLDYKGQTIAW